MWQLSCYVSTQVCINPFRPDQYFFPINGQATKGRSIHTSGQATRTVEPLHFGNTITRTIMPHISFSFIKKRTSIKSLREMCPNTEFFWSVFSRIWTKCGNLLRVSPYSVQIRENMDQKNSVFGHFLHSENIYLWSVSFCEDQVW